MLAMGNIQASPFDGLIGRVLKDARTAQGLTQEDLASAVRDQERPMSRLMVTNTENGKRAIEMGELKALGTVLGVRPSELIRQAEELEISLDDVAVVVAMYQQARRNLEAAERDRATAQHWLDRVRAMLQQRADELTREQRAECGIE